MSVRSDFYGARADECARDAADEALPNVRDRHLRAEAAWRAMADRDLRAEVMRERERLLKDA